MTRIFFSTDVHGSERCWKKLVNAGKFYKADLVILGGDITGKMVVPIVKQSDVKYRSDFLERTEVLEEDQLNEHKTYVRNTGYYPYVCNQDELKALEADRVGRDKLFSDLMIATLKDWIKFADERLNNTDLKIYVCPGNDDRFDIDPLFEGARSIVNAEGRVIYIDDCHEMISSGWCNPTPWKTQREVSEEELKSRIETQITQVKDIKNCIFNLHSPPYGTLLDNAPHLVDLKPDLSKQDHVGSTAVYELIKKYQPLLGLHGHIHESKGKCQIGRTVCINPGSDYADGILAGYNIGLERGQIKGLFPVSG